jgi:hypothetical protein
MLLSNKMAVTIWLTLLWFYLRIWLSPSWILPSAAKAFPASVTKQLALIPSQLPTWPWYVRMYDRWDDSHFLMYHPCRHLLYFKTIVVPYVDTNAKVTNFLPFRTNGISMYQKNILPYFIIPSTFSPQASSPLSHHRRTTFFTPCYLSSFFFPLSARGPTRRRNSTGLAELWGGWPIEQA